MPCHLTKEEYEKLLEWRKQGLNYSQIAKRVGKSRWAVSRVFRKKRERFGNDHPKKSEESYEMEPFEEEDLSSLPDNQLFKHQHFSIP